MKLFETNPVQYDAFLSNDGLYRYSLTRRWDESDLLCWIMLNPSTADADNDDPTIRRCMSFARAWGYGGILVVNLFAFRATDPKELVKATDPIGPCNNSILETAAKSHVTVAAWGCGGALKDRGGKVRGLLGDCELLCLGLTKDRYPKHPLYVPADTVAVPF